MAAGDEYRARIARRRTSVRVLLDQSLVEEHAAADARLQAAMLDDDSIAESPAVTTARAEVEALEAAITAAEVEFVFEGIGRQRWLALVADHPPTTDQQAQGYDFNPDTFQPAAIAASTVVPDDIDLDVAEMFAAELDLAEFGKLWSACLEANVGVAARPKSVAASVLRRTSGRSSST